MILFRYSHQLLIFGNKNFPKHFPNFFFSKKSGSVTQNFIKASCQKSNENLEKNNDPIPRKYLDRRTEIQFLEPIWLLPGVQNAISAEDT